MTDRVSIPDLEGAPAATALAGEPRVVRVALAAGEALPAHDHPGATVLFYVVTGALDVALDGASHALAEGDLLRCSGEREIAVAAVEDAVALVTLVEASDG